jgi:hypothetical protein
MLTNIKTYTTSYVIDLPDERFPRAETDELFNDLDAKMNNLPLRDWKLAITYFFVNTDHTGVTKKQRTVATDKEYSYTILMPVPEVKLVEYGLQKKSFQKYHDDKLLYDAYFYEMVDFKKYKSLKDLFIDCAKQSIDILVNKGIRINGKLTKLK